MTVVGYLSICCHFRMTVVGYLLICCHFRMTVVGYLHLCCHFRITVVALLSRLPARDTLLWSTSFCEYPVLEHFCTSSLPVCDTKYNIDRGGSPVLIFDQWCFPRCSVFAACFTRWPLFTPCPHGFALLYFHGRLAVTLCVGVSPFAVLLSVYMHVSVSGWVSPALSMMFHYHILCLGRSTLRVDW